MNNSLYYLYMDMQNTRTPILVDRELFQKTATSESNNISVLTEDCGMIEKDFQKTAEIIQNAELREKIASTMLQLNSKNKEHEKRAQATKLLYKQAEMGLLVLPSTYDEFEQKLASLIRQDLAVLEKAMELTAIDGIKLGELAGSDTNTVDAAATFQADVLS